MGNMTPTKPATHLEWLELIAELAETKPFGKSEMERLHDICIATHLALADLVPGHEIPEKIRGSIEWRRQFLGALIVDQEFIPLKGNVRRVVLP